MLNVTTARAAAKETKFEYEQCYVVDVVSELCGPESQLGYQNVTSKRDNKTYCPISDFAVSRIVQLEKGQSIAYGRFQRNCHLKSWSSSLTRREPLLLGVW